MRKAIYPLIAAGAALMLYRAVYGLGAVTALSDYQPWGLVKAVNIFFGASLPAGSFVLAASVYVFGARSFRPLVRPALLMGFIGHTFVLIALFYDVGRPLYVWRIMTNPHASSALLWTAWSETAYTAVMVVELLPDALRRADLVRMVEKVKVPLVILAAVLAVVYQYSLGTLFLAAPLELAPAWSGRWLPALFILSAVAGGLGMVVIERTISGRQGRRKTDPAVIRRTAALMGVFLALYMLVRVADLVTRGALSGGSPLRDAWLITEICAGVLAPIVLLLIKRVRETAWGLVAASSLTLFGVLINRLGVTIVGWELPKGASYFPSPLEFMASVVFLLAAASLYWYASGLLLANPSPVPEVQAADLA